MTQQEKEILRGMYAAGFRYVVREGTSLLFSEKQFILTSPEIEYKWDLPVDCYDGVDDLAGKADSLFQWIKASDSEPVEILEALRNFADNLSN